MNHFKVFSRWGVFSVLLEHHHIFTGRQEGVSYFSEEFVRHFLGFDDTKEECPSYSIHSNTNRGGENEHFHRNIFYIIYILCQVLRLLRKRRDSVTGSQKLYSLHSLIFELAILTGSVHLLIFYFIIIE